MENFRNLGIISVMGEVIPFTGVHRTEEEWEAIDRFEKGLLMATRKAVIETRSLEFGPQLATQVEDHSRYTVKPLEELE